jgi:16S rRNA pseudouridine516 synthase
VAEIEGMFAHLEQALVAIDFLNPDNPKKLMPRLKRMFARASWRPKRSTSCAASPARSWSRSRPRPAGKNKTNKERADMAKLTLDRILQSQGFGSRKYCRELIEDGEVSIHGEVVDDYRATPDTNGLVLTIFEEEWEYREHVYIAINKPQNIECSRKPSHHPGVLTLLPEQFTWRDVQPVGRLDHDTTGLLLMSDDGAFIHAQSSPKRHVPKVYAATTAEPVTEALIAQLKAGVQLHDEPAPLAATAAASWGEPAGNRAGAGQVSPGQAHAGGRRQSLQCLAAYRHRWLAAGVAGTGRREWTYLDAEQMALLVPDAE